MHGTLAQSQAPISCSFVAVGWELAFPIDYSTNKHWELTTTPTAVTSYSKNLAKYLEVSSEVAKILVDKICAYHHKDTS